MVNDKNNMLLVMSKREKSPTSSDLWQVEKEFNLIKEFNTNEVYLLS
jgi:hypothetical protein